MLVQKWGKSKFLIPLFALYWLIALKIGQDYYVIGCHYIIGSLDFAYVLENTIVVYLIIKYDRKYNLI